MNYNPYDLVPLLINGKQIHGRPFEFDSVVVDQKTMLNRFGTIVKPSKVATTCPDCGQGLYLDLKLGDPPFVNIICVCSFCNPVPPIPADPFINPIVTGRVQLVQLDPIVSKAVDDGSSVEECFNVEPAPLVIEPPRKGKTKQIVAPKPVEQIVIPKPVEQVVTQAIVEKADGISEEVDFDDSGMLEDT